jgi:hypothetical protein
MSTDDFFRARLETMIDMRRPLAVLATRMPWKEIEAALAPVLAHKARAGRSIEGADLFGPTLAVAGAGVSNPYPVMSLIASHHHAVVHRVASMAPPVLRAVGPCAVACSADNRRRVPGRRLRPFDDPNP